MAVKHTDFHCIIKVVHFPANCFAPVFSQGVVLLSSTSTFAGGVIIYNCSEGFQPGTVQTSVCADNGQWDPNTTLHTCTG